jgi:hypothetical protein
MADIELSEVAKCIPHRQGLVLSLGGNAFKYVHPYEYRSGGDSHRVAMRIEKLFVGCEILKHGEIFTHQLTENYGDVRDKPHWFVRFRLPEDWERPHQVVDLKPYESLIMDYEELGSTGEDPEAHALAGGVVADLRDPDIRLENNDGVELEYCRNLADAAAQLSAVDSLAEEAQRKERVFFWQKAARSAVPGETIPYTPRYKAPKTSRVAGVSFPSFKDGETRIYTPDLTELEKAGVLNVAHGPTEAPLGGYHLKPAWRVSAVKYWAARWLEYYGTLPEITPHSMETFVKQGVQYWNNDESRPVTAVVLLVARHFLEGTSALGWPHFIRDVTATARAGSSELTAKEIVEPEEAKDGE